MKQIQSYTYTIPANGSVQIPAPNDNFIVQSATGPVTVRGDTFGTLPELVAGQGLKMVPFNRLELLDVSGAPNTVTVLLSPAEFLNQVFSGSVAITSLAQSIINSLVRPELPGANWNSNATVAANTPLTVFEPGANTNGAIIWQAEAWDSAAGSWSQTFIAKGSAPATVVDGEIVAQSIFQIAATANVYAIKTEEPRRIAAGLGLYFISSTAGAAGALRNCRFTLL